MDSSSECRAPQLRHRRLSATQLARLVLSFLIFSANSIPEIVTAALVNRLNPSMSRIQLLHSPMDTRLFKYWLERTFTRRGSSPSSFTSRTALCEAA